MVGLLMFLKCSLSTCVRPIWFRSEGAISPVFIPVIHNPLNQPRLRSFSLACSCFVPERIMHQAAGLERLYVDFDSFFATAEQHLRPELRGRPVGVIPIDSPHTGLIAASREAKAVGVKRGFWVREARRACPGLVLVPARHDAYVGLHGDIVKAVNDVVPLLAVRSIDEMVCALSPGDQAHPEAIGRAVKAGIAREVGPVLTCSVGIGPTELLAKIAAEMQKPDGLVVIRPEDLPGPLLRLQITDIPGVARGNAARLRQAGVTDMAGFWSLAPKQARAIWGNVEGERLWAELHGYPGRAPGDGARHVRPRTRAAARL